MNEEELQNAIGKLEKGESVTLNIDGQDITYINPPEPAPVCEEHYYENAGVGEAKCKNCINGVIFDPKEYELKEGKLVRL